MAAPPGVSLYIPLRQDTVAPMPDNLDPAACETETPIRVYPGSSRSFTTIRKAIVREDDRVIKNLIRDGDLDKTKNHIADRARARKPQAVKNAHAEREALVQDIQNGETTPDEADPIDVTNVISE